MSFLQWLISIDPETDWLSIRDAKGVVGIEERLVAIVQESGYLNLSEVYMAFFVSGEPWKETV